MRSGLKAFILVSRQFGVNVGANDIPESYKTEDREVSLRELAALAQKFGLKAKAGKVGEAQLAKLLSKRQQLLRLDNNRYIIALRYTKETDGSDTLLVLDPSFQRLVRRCNGDLYRI